MLGGTSFVGGAVVDAALERGWSVTTFNRGNRHELRSGVQHVVGDRTRPYDVAALGSGRWDVAVDTWAAAPVVVRTSAELLSDVVGRYVYVSSRAVYAMPYPDGLDESAPTVAAAAGAPSVGYSEDKRGGELAVEEVFGSRALLARSGVILGPGENLGRMRCWLAHVGRNATVLAPGDPDQPWRFIDVRDLADWMLRAAQDGAGGAHNLVNRLGTATTGSFLDACRRAVLSGARFQWTGTDALARAGVDRYEALPGWIPPEPDYAGFLTTDTDKAAAAGLRCRPVAETVADTLEWLRVTGGLAHSPERDGDLLGLDPEVERRALADRPG